MKKYAAAMMIYISTIHSIGGIVSLPSRPGAIISIENRLAAVTGKNRVIIYMRKSGAKMITPMLEPRKLLFIMNGNEATFDVLEFFMQKV